MQNSYYDRRTGKLYEFNSKSGRFEPQASTYIDNCGPFETPQFLTPDLLETMNTNVMSVLRTRPDIAVEVYFDSLGEMHWRFFGRTDPSNIQDLGSKGLAGNFNSEGWAGVQNQVRLAMANIR